MSTKDQLIERVVKTCYADQPEDTQRIVRGNLGTHYYTKAQLELMLREHARAQKDFDKVLGYGRDLPGDSTLYPGVGEAPFRNGKLITVADLRKYNPELLASLHDEAQSLNEIHDAATNQATPRYATFVAAVFEGKSYRDALDILHAEAVAEA